MPVLYMVVGLEWAAVIYVPQVKIVLSHQPGILKVGDGIKRFELQTQSLPLKYLNLKLADNTTGRLSLVEYYPCHTFKTLREIAQLD